jgi:hypothetical protein
MNSSAQSFRLAKMSPLILALTIPLLAMPFLFLAGAFKGRSILTVPGVLVVAIYAWIWLRFRPTRFEIHPAMLEVIWPLKRRWIPRSEISDVRLIDGKELRARVGWGLRVGAGGLWGGFGWLWTRKRGIVQMYISRVDRFVWIECGGRRPWLITPDEPEAFVRALTPV